jgi:hypothetical protein
MPDHDLTDAPAAPAPAPPAPPPPCFRLDEQASRRALAHLADNHGSGHHDQAAAVRFERLPGVSPHQLYAALPASDHEADERVGLLWRQLAAAAAPLLSEILACELSRRGRAAAHLAAARVRR